MARRKDEEKVISSEPRQAVIFYPFVNRFEDITQKNILNTKRVDVTSSVVNLTYSDSKSNASGTFSMILTPDQNWTQILKPGDWGMIYISQFGINSKTTKGLKALINIDRVSRQKATLNDGRKKITYRISGRDFGKIFEKTRFYYNPYVPKEVQDNFVILKSGIKITGTPEAFVRSYLGLYFGDGFIIKKNQKTVGELRQKLEKLDQVRIPPAIYEVFKESKDSGKLSDILKVEIGKDILTPEGYSWSIPPDRAISSSIWDIMKSVSNPLMNELYLSMRYYPEQDKVFPTLTLRKIPFAGHTSHKKKTYTSLTSIRVQENQIISDDVGFNDHERYNYLNFDPQLPLIAGYSQFMAASREQREDKFLGKNVPLFPFIDQASIIRHGFNELPGLTSEFVQIDQGDKKQAKEKTDIKLAERWMKELIEWWLDYERYESGTLIIKGFSEINTIQQSKKTGLPLINNKPIEGGLSATLKARLGADRKLQIPVDHFNLGENLYLNSRERLLHMEAYTHEWIAPGEWTVTLVTTRGVAVKRNNPIGSPYRFVDEVESETQEDVGITVIKRKNS